MFCSEGTAEMCGLSRPLRLYNMYQPWPAVSFKTDFLFLCNVCHRWRRVAEHLVILMFIATLCLRTQHTSVLNYLKDLSNLCGVFDANGDLFFISLHCVITCWRVKRF